MWIPDGYKDVTIDRKGPRELLKQSLDEIFAAPIDEQHNLVFKVETHNHPSALEPYGGANTGLGLSLIHI